MTDHQIKGARWKRQRGTVRTDAQGLAGWKNAVEVGIHGDDGTETRIIVKASFTRAKIENRLAPLASLEPIIQEMHDQQSLRITNCMLAAIVAGR